MSTPPTLQPVPGLPGYLAGDDGSIWRSRGGEVYRLGGHRRAADGYVIVDVWQGGATGTATPTSSSSPRSAAPCPGPAW
jgi:hypothetical protein